MLLTPMKSELGMPGLPLHLRRAGMVPQALLLVRQIFSTGDHSLGSTLTSWRVSRAR